MRLSTYTPGRTNITMSGYTPIPPTFFNRPTLEVARELLGHWIVRHTSHGSPLVARVVEVEAYTGDDPACHAYTLARNPRRPRKGRSADLFAAPGLTYIYLNYGVHWLLNVITEPQGKAGAVLIRAVEPLEGIEHMRRYRPVRSLRELTNGPGKLTRALQITGALHLHPTTEPPLQLVFAPEPPSEPVVQTPRIGIQKGTDLPWRFLLEGNPFVSR